MAASACAPARWAPPDPAAAERAARLPSYRARLRVRLDAPGLRARSRVLVAFRRPDALRLEVPGPLGARLLAVSRDGRLAAVFPEQRAVYRGEATPAALSELFGVALSPQELIDLLAGVASTRLRAFRAEWGGDLPRRIEATLPDGARLRVDVEDAAGGVALPSQAFDEPEHGGYRAVDAREARRMWVAR